MEAGYGPRLLSSTTEGSIVGIGLTSAGPDKNSAVIIFQALLISLPFAPGAGVEIVGVGRGATFTSYSHQDQQRENQHEIPHKAPSSVCPLPGAVWALNIQRLSMILVILYYFTEYLALGIMSK
ncbi:MAG: hypothetical protein D6E12_11890 [Desulfovibrio sp.]|nr:MAG: hypothetical protein D6E12_11890 [Desulfovibrio sp.]